MRKINIVVLCLIIFASEFVFCMSPRFRDEFYIENKTSESLVIVLENIRSSGMTFSRGYFDYNGQTISFQYSPVNEPSKEWRTIKSGERLRLGIIEHNNEQFNLLSPLEKFKFFSDIYYYSMIMAI